MHLHTDMPTTEAVCWMVAGSLINIVGSAAEEIVVMSLGCFPCVRAPSVCSRQLWQDKCVRTLDLCPDLAGVEHLCCLCDMCVTCGALCAITAWHLHLQ